MKEAEFIWYGQNRAGEDGAVLPLLSDYFDELFADSPQDNIPKKYLPRILDEIGDEEKPCRIWMCLCVKGGELIGFGIFQIDAKGNPWCEREGWGFIREFYIRPEHRRNGHARALLHVAEGVLRDNGAQEVYLTAESPQSIAFWEACGYVFSGETYSGNGGKIFEKHGLAKTDA